MNNKIYKMEITVFDVPDKDIIVSKSQKQKLYEDLEKENVFSKLYVWTLFHLDEYNESQTIPISSINSILIKYILKYCTPIISDDGISVEFDTDLLAIQNGKPINIPAGKQFKVKSIRVDSLIKKYPKNVLAFYDYIKDYDLAQSGHYGVIDHQTDVFTQQRNIFHHIGKLLLSSFHITDKSAVPTKLVEYIEMIYRYYQNNFPTIRYEIEANPIDAAIDKWKLSFSNNFDVAIMTKLKEILSFGAANIDIISTLERESIYKLYNIGRILGISDPAFKKQFEIVKNKILKNKELMKQINIGYTSQLRLVQMRSIAEDKYGESDLSKLTKKQLEVINLTLKKMSVKDSDKFDKLLTATMETDSSHLAKEIKNVEKMFTSKQLNGETLIGSSSCPHVYHYAVKTLELFNQPSLGTAIREFLIDKFALPEDPAGFFCKICGAKLAESDRTAAIGFTGDYSSADTDDPLQTMIWKEALYIVTHYVRFVSPVPTKPLVNSLAKGLREVVSYEESKLMKSKTNTGENIKDTTNLFATMYIYASLCALMIANPGKLVFAFESNAKKGGSQRLKTKLKYKYGGTVTTNQKVAEKFYLTTALKLIILTKETLISRIKNIDLDYIKQFFVKSAYTWAIKHARPIQVSSADSWKNKEVPVYTNPFYMYTYIVKKVLDKNAPKDLLDINKIIGMNDAEVLSAIKNSKSPFEKVTVPDFGKTPLDVYRFKSYERELEYRKEQIYKKTAVPRHVQFTEFIEKYKEIYSIQNELELHKRISNARPNLNIVIYVDLLAKLNNFSPRLIDLTQYYCNNGEHHKTGNYVYSDGKSSLELSKKDIVEWLTSNNTVQLEKFAKMYIIDERCEKCKKLIYTNDGTKSVNSIKKAFSKLDNIYAFYTYYDTRCPKGGLHDISGDKCKSCGFKTSYVVDNNEEYYDKYESVFHKIQLEKKKLASNTLEQMQHLTEYVKEDVSIEYHYSLKNTAEWSQLSGIKYNILVNIGLSEKNKFAEIEQSKINPSKTKKPSMTRAIRLKGYIKSIMRSLNNITRHDVIVDLHPMLKSILNEQRKSSEVKKISDIIPNLSDFTFDDEKHSKLPIENYINFLQEYLAEIFIKLENIPEKYKVLSKGLISYFLDTILESEKMLSKVDPVFTRIDEATDNESDESNEWETRILDKSESEGTDSDTKEQNEVETYENEIDTEGYDVENADEIWETE